MIIRLSNRVCSIGYNENHDHFQSIQITIDGLLQSGN